MSMNKRIAKIALVAILFVVGFGASLAFFVVSAYAGETEIFLNDDPFATSREEAMKNRLEAFAVLNLPGSDIARMLRITEKPGKKTRVSQGSTFQAMVWGRGIVYTNIVLTPKEPFLPAESWEVNIRGIGGYRILYVFLVSVPGKHSFNWAFAASETVMAYGSRAIRAKQQEAS